MNAAFPFLALLAAPAVPAPAPAPAAAIRACEDAYLGVYVTSSSAGGAEVARLMDGSPALEAGLQAGDRIVSFAGHEVEGADALVALVNERSAGDQVEVVFYRGGEKHHCAIELKTKDSGQGLGPIWEGARSWGGSTPSPAHGEGSFDATDERWSALMEHHAALAAEWWSEFEERMQDLQTRLDERWDELEGEIDALLADRTDAASRERMARVRQELERDREARAQRMEEVRAKMKAAEAEVRARLEALRSERAQSGGGTLFFRFPREEPAAPGSPERSVFRGPIQLGAAGSLGSEVQTLRSEVGELRAEIQALKELLKGRGER